MVDKIIIPITPHERNLIIDISEIIKDFFHSENYKEGQRDLEVLSYRNGLFGHAELTLEEISIVLDSKVTRERVRQLENRASQYLSELMNSGECESKNISINQKIFSKIREYKESLFDLKDVFCEEEAVGILSKSYQIINCDIPLLRLLIKIFGFQPLIIHYKALDSGWLWAKKSINVARIKKVISEVNSYLITEAIPKTLQEINLSINDSTEKT